jgi:hypothetical protein
LYINDEDGNYDNLDTNNDGIPKIDKPSGADYVPTLIATATLPAGYTVSEWRLNNEVLQANGLLITLPLSKKEIVDKLQPGENILSVIITNEENTDYKSGFLKFYYDVTSPKNPE